MGHIQTARFGVPPCLTSGREYEVRPQANYRPRISPEQLTKLWLLKQRTGRPITKLVAEAIEDYLVRPACLAARQAWQAQKGGEG